MTAFHDALDHSKRFLELHMGDHGADDKVDTFLEHLHPHAQWMVLTRAHLEMLLLRASEVGYWADRVFWAIESGDHWHNQVALAPDELVLGTLLCWWGEKSRIENTWVCAAYFRNVMDPHAVTWEGMNCVKYVQEVDKGPWR
jgi:hypothetical protein